MVRRSSGKKAARVTIDISTGAGYSEKYRDKEAA